jgi:membrane protease YdiL (CAAX protease family)
MTTKQDALKIIGLYFLVMLSTLGVQYILVPLFHTQLENESFAITFNTSLNLIIYGILAFLFIILFKRLFRFDWKITKQNISDTVKFTLIGFGLMIVFIIINSLVYQFFNITETSENQAAINFMFENGRMIDWILLVIFTVLLAPVVEEFVFRKAIMTFFKTTPLAGIIISGIAFGYIHVTSGDYVQIIYYMTIGAVLGAFYYISKYNIFVPIIMHMIFNGFLVSMMLIQLSSM